MPSLARDWEWDCRSGDVGLRNSQAWRVLWKVTVPRLVPRGLVSIIISRLRVSSTTASSAFSCPSFAHLPSQSSPSTTRSRSSKDDDDELSLCKGYLNHSGLRFHINNVARPNRQRHKAGLALTILPRAGPEDQSQYSESSTVSDIAAWLDYMCGAHNTAIAGGLGL